MSRRDGLGFYCKACASTFQKKYYKKNKKKMRKWYKNYRLQNKEKIQKRKKDSKVRDPIPCMLRSARNRAKDAAIPFNLTESYVRSLLVDVCPYLGIPLVYGGRAGIQFGSASLDRIENLKGYVIGNVEIISWRANTIKSDGTAEEHRKIANRMDNIQGDGQ